MIQRTCLLLGQPVSSTMQLLLTLFYFYFIVAYFFIEGLISLHVFSCTM